jgi:predicted HTH transcriptional regulator
MRQRWLGEIAEQLWSAKGSTDPKSVVVPDYPFIDVANEADQVRAMMSAGESSQLEFKSTARVNTHTGGKDPDIEKSVGKSICAFANSHDGGTLLIGVGPDGSPVGIEEDYPFVHSNDRDGFELWLARFISQRIDPVLAGRVRLSFSTVQGVTVCRVDVPPSTEPVFFDDKGTQRFYVRVQNATNEYSGHSLLKYKAERWPSA